jgi:outer membrane biosynthesis protein TonB
LYMWWTSILAGALLAPPLPAHTASYIMLRDIATEARQDAGASPQSSPPEPAPEDRQSETTPAQPVPSTEGENPKTENPTEGQPKTDSRNRRSRNRKSVAEKAGGPPRKVVIRHGGAPDAVSQIVPGITEEEAIHQRENAEQLLVSTDSNLKQLTGRSLTLNRQETVVQIRQYVDGARLALKESDTQRAHTLALKAYWLSDDLLKH